MRARRVARGYAHTLALLLLLLSRALPFITLSPPCHYAAAHAALSPRYDITRAFAALPLFADFDDALFALSLCADVAAI